MINKSIINMTQLSETRNAKLHLNNETTQVIRLKNTSLHFPLLPEGVTLNKEGGKTIISVTNNAPKDLLFIYEINAQSNVTEEFSLLVEGAKIHLHTIFMSGEEGNVIHQENNQKSLQENEEKYHLFREIHAKKESMVTLTSVQDTPSYLFISKDTDLFIEESANLSETTLILASGKVVEKTRAFLCGRNAHLVRKEGSITDRYIEQETVISHLAENTTANVVSKSFVEAKGEWMGKSTIKAETIAKNTVSFIRNDAILLDKEARAKTIPALEIKAEDVQVGHASSVSHISTETLFYLQTRGLTKDEARETLKKGFLQSYLSSFPVGLIEEK